MIDVTNIGRHDKYCCNSARNEGVGCCKKEKYQRRIYDNKKKWRKKSQNRYNGGGNSGGILERNKWGNDKKAGKVTLEIDLEMDLEMALLLLTLTESITFYEIKYLVGIKPTPQASMASKNQIHQHLYPNYLPLIPTTR